MDGGWSWVVMVACFCSVFLCSLAAYSVGVLHVALLEAFGQDKAKTAWVGAIHSSLMTLAGPVAGAVVGRLGCRAAMVLGGVTILLGSSLSAFANSVDVLMVTYGLIAGVGLGLCYVPSVVATGFHFDRYRGLASSIAATGGGLGMFAGGPVMRLLLDTYGLKGTFLMLGAIGCHNCLFGLMIRPSQMELRIRRLELQAERREVLLHGAPSLFHVAKEAALSYLTLFKYYGFVCHTVSVLLWSVGFAAIMLHLPGYSESLGSSPTQAASLFAGTGVGSVVARLLTGPMLSTFTQHGSIKARGNNQSTVETQEATEEDLPEDKDAEIQMDEKSGFEPLTMHLCGLGLSGLAMMLFPLYSGTYYGQMALAVLFGLYSGLPTALFTPLTVELAGVDRLASAFGFQTLMLGIGYILGPPLTGLILDNGGTYTDSILFSGATTMLGSLTCFVTCVLHAKYKPSPPALSPAEVKVKVTAMGSVGFLPPAVSLGHLSSTMSLHFRLAESGSMSLLSASLSASRAQSIHQVPDTSPETDCSLPESKERISISPHEELLAVSRDMIT